MCILQTVPRSALIASLVVVPVTAPPACADFNHFELAPIVSVADGTYLIGGSSEIHGVGSGAYYFQRIPSEFPLQIREADAQCTVQLTHCTDPMGDDDDLHCAGGGIWNIEDDCAGETLSMFSFGANMGPDRFLYESSCSQSPPPPPPPSPAPTPPPPFPTPPSCAFPMAIVYVVDRSSSLQPVAAHVRSLLHWQLDFVDYATSVAAIVAYGNEATVVSDFSTDEQALHEAVETSFADALFNDITHMSAGFAAANALFATLAGGAEYRAVVLLTDGENNEAFGGATAAIASAAETKANGIAVFALAMSDPDMAVVHELVSPPPLAHAVDVDASGGLNATWQLYEMLCSSPTQQNATSCEELEEAWEALGCCGENKGGSGCARVEALHARGSCCG